MELHEKLRLIVEEKGWTHDDLARLIDRSRPTVTQYLSGTCKPPLKVLTKIARLAGVSLDYFSDEKVVIQSPVRAEIVLTHADGRIERMPLSPEAQAMIEVGRKTARAHRKRRSK
ncbi:MAG: helix-turn-helix transcriptional regulator [Bacillota bacterium]